MLMSARALKLWNGSELFQTQRLAFYHFKESVLLKMSGWRDVWFGAGRNPSINWKRKKKKKKSKGSP